MQWQLQQQHPIVSVFQHLLTFCFSKDMNSTFSVTVVEGTQSTTFPLEQVFVDPMTNLRIGVHYPMMDYSQSSRSPKAKGGGLSSMLYVVYTPDQPQSVITTIENNFKTNPTGRCDYFLSVLHSICNNWKSRCR